MSPAIWILAETGAGGVSRLSGQLAGAARRLAADKDMEVVGVLTGGERAAAEALAALVPRVAWIDDPSLAPYEATRHLHALCALVEARGAPAALLGGASSAGLELLPRMAARLRTGYTGSCVDAWWEGNRLAVRRPVYGGRAYEEIAFAGTPAVATFRPGAFAAAERLAASGEIEVIASDPMAASAPSVIERSSTTEGRDIAEAARVVAGGRGLGSAENFGLLEALAGVLDASVAASRSVVDAGWRPHDEQVGKSGKTISPELYIACGISGAIHHVLGMNTARVVAAINTDPGALIFQHADLGLVADATMAVPALTEKLKALLKK
jgi:electron transfer flavoprotein alpha subunit